MSKPEMSVEMVKAFLDAVVLLTKIRQQGCNHLCVENFAPECLENMLKAYIKYSQEFNANDNQQVPLSDSSAG